MAARGRSRKAPGFSLAAAGEAVGTAMGRAVGRVERIVKLARQRITGTRRASAKRPARPRRKAARTRA
jgi:hypothetical protein